MTVFRTEVVRGLHQGGRSDAVDMLREWEYDHGQPHHLPRFDALVLCAEEVQPDAAMMGKWPRNKPQPPILRVPLRDEEVPLSPQQRAMVTRAAREVARRVGKHQRVLVTCAMGLNRSGLVTALALRALGATSRDAVTLVRKARGPLALSNSSFEALVHTLRQEELRL